MSVHIDLSLSPSHLFSRSISLSLSLSRVRPLSYTYDLVRHTMTEHVPSFAMSSGIRLIDTCDMTHSYVMMRHECLT